MKASTEEHFEQSPDDSAALAEYFTNLMRGIIRRESAVMDPLGGGKIYSLDATRDYAIPAVTRYVADFLGLGHMVRSEANRLAKYSENDLYQHITNCQVYLSYNADETRLLKRRLAFKRSMRYLYRLVLEEGIIMEANKSMITRKISSFRRWLFGSHRDHTNPMTTLGLTVATHILTNEPELGKAVPYICSWVLIALTPPCWHLLLFSACSSMIYTI